MELREDRLAVQLTFLGTGAGMPSKERNTSSLVLELNDVKGSLWMFDCGEATQHQILKTHIKPRKIQKIFITHLHGDHIFGLPGFISSRSFLSGETPLTIYGPKGIKQFIDTALVISKTNVKYELEIIEIDSGVIFDDDKYTVYAHKLQHVIPSFGFRIVQRDLPGQLLIDKALAFGVPKGPFLKKLKNGEDVVLENGRIVKSEDVLGPKKKGAIITILGDTKYCSEAIELAKNADVVIHEATFDNSTTDLAALYGHSTNIEAAKVALQANAKALILNHISARFIGKDLEKLFAEAKQVFPKTYLADDFSHFDLKHLLDE